LGKLVQFDRRQRDLKPRTGRSNPAEILIFTGVRYERAETKEPDKPTATSSPARPKRKRG
jgi:hypothetical protein